MRMDEYEQIKALEAEIEALKDQQRMLGKKDIMEIFGKGSDFALRFLRVAKASGYGIKVGKEYYIRKERFEQMMENYEGLALAIWLPDTIRQRSEDILWPLFFSFGECFEWEHNAFRVTFVGDFATAGSQECRKNGYPSRHVGIIVNYQK